MLGAILLEIHRLESLGDVEGQYLQDMLKAKVKTFVEGCDKTSEEAPPPGPRRRILLDKQIQPVLSRHRTIQGSSHRNCC